MTVLPRRRVLQTSGVSLAALGAGCSSLHSFGPDETRIGRIRALNRDTSHYTANVLILEDDEPVYFDSMEIEGGSEDGDEAGTVEFEEYPEEVGEYVLFAWVDDQPSSEWAEFDTTERDECTRVYLTIGRQADAGEIEVRSSEGCPDDDTGDGDS